MLVEEFFPQNHERPQANEPGPLTVYGQLNVRNINEVGEYKTLIVINNITIAININISIKSTNAESNIIQVDDSKMMISLHQVSLR